MTWKYEPMRMEFERVLVLTLVLSVGLPLVACSIAESYAEHMLKWAGFLYQLGALGMAAYELNKLDVVTFKGPGFMVRMGWKPGPPVSVQLTGSSIGVATSTGRLSIGSQTSSVDERLRRLEESVESLEQEDQALRRAINAEVKDRKEADQAIQTEVNTRLGTVDAKLKEATLGDLEWVYVALILGLVGTVFSTFSEGLGRWF